MSNKLKPCPFCGSTETFFICGALPTFRVCCANCYAWGPLSEEKKEATEAWNRRAE